MQIRKALLIHGFEGASNSNWLPWLEKELLEQNWIVTNKTLPSPEHPDIQEIMNFLKDLTRDFGNRDIIVAHSLGAFFTIKLAELKEFGAIFLVGPAIMEIDVGKFERIWPNSDINSLSNVIGSGVSPNQCMAKKKVVLLSSNDPYIHSHVSKEFDKSWQIHTLKNRGHLDAKEIPELLTLISQV